jgi:hypothetical protein
MRHALLPVALLGLVPLLAAACAQSDAFFGDAAGGGRDAAAGGVLGRACQAHVDCGGQAACLDGVCARECEQDFQCPDPSFLCWGFRCLPRSGGGSDIVQPRGDECSLWSDCDQSTPRGCRNGYCVAPECYSDAECPDAARPACVFYVCGSRTPPGDTVSPRDVVQPPDGGPVGCTTFNDCPASAGPEACRSGVCVPAECTTDADCPAPARCVLFLCQGAPPPPDVVQPRDVPAPPDGPRPPDVPQSPMLGYGEPCDRDFPNGGCASETCLYNKNAGTYTCTRECAAHSDCPAPDWCGGTEFTPPLPIDVCLPSDAGQPCNALGGCTSGLSFGAGGGCVCTHPCPSAHWCPANYACPADATGARLCRPIGAACTPSAQGDPVCRGQLCYPLDLNATTGVCTTTCSSSSPGDCPSGWFCYAEVIEGQTIQTCQRLN